MPLYTVACEYGPIAFGASDVVMILYAASDDIVWIKRRDVKGMLRLMTDIMSKIVQQILPNLKL